MRHDDAFPVSDLVLVTDTTPVEHVGGPDDGLFLPLCGNAKRPGGFYVPVNHDGAVIEMRYLPI